MRNTPTTVTPPKPSPSAAKAAAPAKVLERLGLSSEARGAAAGPQWLDTNGPSVVVRSPIDGSNLATVRAAGPDDVRRVIDAADDAFKAWRLVPGPKRGELVRRIGNRLRERKADLAALVTWESGKITQEALGEVQEMIDVCDFAV